MRPDRAMELLQETKLIENDLRIATSLAKLKRDQATRAEQRVVDLQDKLSSKKSEMAQLPKDNSAQANDKSILDTAQEGIDSFNHTANFLSSS